MTVSLYPHQVDAHAKVRASMMAGNHRVMLCGPTGFGKTHVAGQVMASVIDRNKRCLFVADRRVLISQASKRLNEMGLTNHGVLMHGHPSRLHRPIQVASAQSLEHIPWWMDPMAHGGDQLFDLVIVDEAHERRAATEKFLLKTDLFSIGLTATPFKKGLGTVWQDLVNTAPANDLIADGYLVPFEVYCGTEVDMDGAPIAGGEWSDKTVQDRALPIIGDVVMDWMHHTTRKFGGPVPTLVFSATVAHGEKLRDRFREVAGATFEQISYKDTDSTLRDAKIEALSSGKIDGLISCEALTKGFDEQKIKCLVMARPYRKAFTNVVQALGRGMRAHPTKTDCLLIDNSGNFRRFAGGNRKLLGARLGNA